MVNVKISAYVAVPMITAGTLLSPGAQAFNLGPKPRAPGAQHVHHGFEHLQQQGLVQHFDHFMEELVRHSSVEMEASKDDNGQPGTPEVRLN